MIIQLSTSTRKIFTMFEIERTNMRRQGENRESEVFDSHLTGKTRGSEGDKKESEVFDNDLTGQT